MSTRCIPAVTGAFAGLRNPDGEAVGESGSGLVAGTTSRLLPPRALGELRRFHAGEAALLQMYRGVLASARDGGLRAIAARRLAVGHLQLLQIQRWLPAPARSRALPLWRTVGWFGGVAAALAGTRAALAAAAVFERAVAARNRRRGDWLSAHPELSVVHAALIARRRDERDRRVDTDLRPAAPLGHLVLVANVASPGVAARRRA
jgi:hypothetical protein